MFYIVLSYSKNFVKWCSTFSRFFKKLLCNILNNTKDFFFRIINRFTFFQTELFNSYPVLPIKVFYLHTHPLYQKYCFYLKVEIKFFEYILWKFDIFLSFFFKISNANSFFLFLYTQSSFFSCSCFAKKIIRREDMGHYFFFKREINNSISIEKRPSTHFLHWMNFNSSLNALGSFHL